MPTQKRKKKLNRQSWEGHKIRTVSIDDVDEIYIENPDKSLFNVKPVTNAITMMFDENRTKNIITKKDHSAKCYFNHQNNRTQFTEKIKTNLIVFNFDYGTKNRIYVVLSIVKT